MSPKHTSRHALTIGDIANKGVEDHSPHQRILERLLELIHLEVLVAHSLLVDPDPLHSLQPLPFRQEAGVQLVVRHHKQEDDTHRRREQADNHEQ